MALLLCSCLALATSAGAQGRDTVSIRWVGPTQKPLSNMSVELLHRDSSILKIFLTDRNGDIRVFSPTHPHYLLRATAVGFKTKLISLYALPDRALTVTMDPAEHVLQGVNIQARKPYIELLPDRTVVNIDASIANVGSTALEALEKLPGVTVDRDGNISLKGRTGVMVMLDGKPTYLAGSELSTLLTSMSAEQIAQIELMDNPPAKFDAAGNAGVINIKTKKQNQRGFNGSLTTTYAQGYYPKNNNNLQLNFRTGRLNFFANYSHNLNNYFTRIEALRTFFNPAGTRATNLLEQPSFLKGRIVNDALTAGIDYGLGERTNLGLTYTGQRMNRDGFSRSTAYWMQADKRTDSVVYTENNTGTRWNKDGGTVSLRHSFSATRSLSADVDLIEYRIRNTQAFENIGVSPTTYREFARAEIPSSIRISSAKADYEHQLKSLKLEHGWKSVRTQTDNLAVYENQLAGLWVPDYGRSNHFLYDETIHALYSAVQTTAGRWSVQGGLRYEMTSYDAKQLGNPLVKDSMFSRRYNSLFPTLNLSYEADSLNSFTFRVGRRIDRPAFQKLNPFQFIINKYTFQQGNPFYSPQFTWNGEVSHLYRKVLLTGLSYSLTTDYFSQLFPIDSNGIVIYTEGNLGRLQNLGLSVGLQLTPAKWWSLSVQTIGNRKRMEGFVTRNTVANITQFTVNMNHQFRFNNGWSGEVIGQYNSRSQHDIQEVLDPSGQLSFGVGKTVFQNRGTLRLAFRDVFYTNWIKGLTQFSAANERFTVTRDTRLVSLSLNLRFGKAFKSNKRSEGAASEETQRVGSGNQ